MSNSDEISRLCVFSRFDSDAGSPFPSLCTITSANLTQASHAESTLSVNAADYSSSGGPGQPSLLEIEAARSGKSLVNAADYSSSGGPDQPSLLEIEAARSGRSPERPARRNMGPPPDQGFSAARRRRMSVAAGNAAEVQANSSIQKFAAHIDSLLHISEQEKLSAVCEVRLSLFTWYVSANSRPMTDEGPPAMPPSRTRSPATAFSTSSTETSYRYRPGASQATPMPGARQDLVAFVTRLSTHERVPCYTSSVFFCRDRQASCAPVPQG